VSVDARFDGQIPSCFRQDLSRAREHGFIPAALHSSVVHAAGGYCEGVPDAHGRGRRRWDRWPAMRATRLEKPRLTRYPESGRLAGVADGRRPDPAVWGARGVMAPARNPWGHMSP